MDNTLIYSNAATELMEIFKYLEKSVSEKIPIKLKEKIEQHKNPNYVFELDKNKALEEQNILPETKYILSYIFIKYCCTEEKAQEILKVCRQNDLDIEREKYEKYNPNNIFKDRDITENIQMVEYKESSVYAKCISKIVSFFKNLFRK